MEPTPTSRRDFLKTSSTVAIGGAIASQIAFPAIAKAEKGDKLKIGFIGCGGRGSGAALQALRADSNVELHAMGDVFETQIDKSLTSLKKNLPDNPEKFNVPKERQFTGLDAYKHVLDSGVDVVILTTPPGFRPQHLRAAVEAGKHIFLEKPMATDAPGVRSVMESVKIAKEKKLAMVAGFCWRYDYPRRELFKRIHDGQIGDIRAMYGTYLTGPVKPMPPASERPAGMTDMEWMVRNWYNFNWLSGDGLVEQAIHAVDWLGWAMNDKPPAKCTAVGGRQIPSEGGNIYDHVEVNYEWEGGVRGFLAQRQITGCYGENNLNVIGSKGIATIARGRVQITGDNPWRYEGPTPDMYQVEHDEMYASIRAGNPINNGDRMVTSTLMGIMGRIAGYTGLEITWDMALNSKQVLVPDIKDWNTKVEVPPIAMPGRTKYV